MGDATAGSELTFEGFGGARIFARAWSAAHGAAPRAVVQIAHGAAEHGLRYAPLAADLCAAGYAVVADDHRGHGRTAGSLDRRGIAGPNAWEAMLADLHALTARIQRDHPGTPVFLLGHSMGSLLAQGYVQRWGDALAGVVLSGTFGLIADLDQSIAEMAPLATGATADDPSEGFAAMFASFNEPFAPGATGFEWLSRDAAAVRAYVEDPWCGFAFSNALALALLTGARETWRPENERRIPRDLPMLVISGDRDPVGANTASVRPLLERYRAHGVEDLTVRFYPEARHELFNETNRAEVQADLRAWLDARSATSRARRAQP